MHRNAILLTLVSLASLVVLAIALFLYRSPVDTQDSRTVVQRLSDPQSLVKEQDQVVHSEAKEPENNNEFTLFSARIVEVVRGIEAGRPLNVQIGEAEQRTYAFRPMRVTTENFQISRSPTEVMPSAFRVYEGREIMGNGGLGDSVSMAVVNDSISLAVETAGTKYFIETDSETGELYAQEIKGARGVEYDGHDPLTCDGFHVGGGHPELYGMQASEELSAMDIPRLPVQIAVGSQASAKIEASDDPAEPEAAWVDHPYFRLGPSYDASLKDISVLMVSGSTQTGSSSNLSSRAATYLTIAARVADTYERQLGLRYLLQEIVLIANDSGQADIEYDDSESANDKNSGSDDLNALESWCNAYRPQSEYGWGHAAGWTLVNGDSGSTIGWAWVDSYGSSSSAFSVQERNWDWDVHSHELGHNVGASHTIGGVMNGSLRNNNEDFYTENASVGGYTAAMDIYNYMGSNSRQYIYGPAELRNAEEIPFGVDDSIPTPLNTPVSFNPLTNDNVSVRFGAANVLRLVETGQVFPKAAGNVEMVGDEIVFTPANGFSGNAWLSYTLGGNVGNGGAGWLHAADVVITVGGNSADPGQTPLLSLTDDWVEVTGTGNIRINPLLNDEGTGRLWAGDVHVVDSPTGSALSFSDDAFHLVGASLIQGNGSLVLEQIAMTRDSNASQQNTGYVVYSPGEDDLDIVVIEYVVEDAFGSSATGTITLSRPASVKVQSEPTQILESSGGVAEYTFRRSSSADLALGETVEFQLTGGVQWFGAEADVAISGYTTIDTQSNSGTVVIPVGASSATLRIVAYDDGIAESLESAQVVITQTSNLAIGEASSAEVSVVEVGEFGVAVMEENFDGFSEPNGIGSGAGAGWINENDESQIDTNWEVQSGGTPSNGTGPSGDATSGNGRYLYVEASAVSNKHASLVTPVIDLTDADAALLAFSYHMQGTSMGDLHIDIRVDGGSWQNDIVPVISGQQSQSGSDWKRANIELEGPLLGNVEVRFRAVTGNSWSSDIAIDDFVIFDTSVAGTGTPELVNPPVPKSVAPGEPLYLSVIAVASPVAGYQWIKDGEDIVGANAPFYYLGNADLEDGGEYSVRVVSASSTTSEPVQVHVGELVETSLTDGFDEDWKDNVFASHPLGSAGTHTEFEQKANGFIANGLLYALQINSLESGAAVGKLPTQAVVESGGMQYLEYSFRRITGGSGSLFDEAGGWVAGSVSYKVEVAGELSEGSWTTSPTLLEQVGEPIGNGDGTETVTVRISQPVNSGAEGVGFIRLKVEPVPAG